MITITINLRKLTFIGLCMIIASIVFGLSETYYFGGNLLPQSPAELACDMIAIIVHFIGSVFLISPIIYAIVKDIRHIRKLLSTK